MNKLELIDWKEKKETPIHLRVFNVFKLWIDNFSFPNEDLLVLEKIKDFAMNVMFITIPIALQLVRSIKKRIQVSGSLKRINTISIVDFPLPILPKNLNKVIKIN